MLLELKGEEKLEKLPRQRGSGPGREKSWAPALEEGQGCGDGEIAGRGAWQVVVAESCLSPGPHPRSQGAGGLCWVTW